MVQVVIRNKVLHALHFRRGFRVGRRSGSSRICMTNSSCKPQGSPQAGQKFTLDSSILRGVAAAMDPGTQQGKRKVMNRIPKPGWNPTRRCSQTTHGRCGLKCTRLTQAAKYSKNSPTWNRLLYSKGYNCLHHSQALQLCWPRCSRLMALRYSLTSSRLFGSPTHLLSLFQL